MRAIYVRRIGVGALLCAAFIGFARLGFGDSPAEIQKPKQIQEIETRIRELEAELKMLREREILAMPSVSYPGILSPSLADASAWRCIGPGIMGGRITALAVAESDPTTWVVATASGGLIKTANNGSSFQHIFDDQATVSVGAVAIAPSDKNTIWVGTGEANPRNSVSFGDGVYKSTDGGKTFRNVGLRDSYQIGAVVVHPKDPNTVYVGALGHLYGTNAERGLFKTTNGGETWEKVWYADDKTGVIEVTINPADPNDVVIGAWVRMRDEFDSFRGASKKLEGSDEYAPSVLYGKSGGIFRSKDGGKSWAKASAGLPSVATGRIGLDRSKKNPNLVFAIIDTESSGRGKPPLSAFFGTTSESANPGVRTMALTDNGPAAKAGVKVGDVFTAFDGQPIGDYNNWVEKLNEKSPGDVVEITLTRDKKQQKLKVTLGSRSSISAVPPKTGNPRPSLGVSIEEEPKGLKITSVVENGPAAKAGLRVGNVITLADSKAVTPRELPRILAEKKAGDKVKINYARGAEALAVDVTLELLAPAPPAAPPGRPYSGGQLGGQIPNAQAKQGPEGVETGGVYRSDDGGTTWRRLNSLNPRPFYFSVIRVDPNDDNTLYCTGVSLFLSTDGGKTFRANEVNKGLHPDQHALWIDPRDGRHMLVGSDGGFYVTYDKAATWEHFDGLSIGQFYHVAVDNKRPYNVYGGLQDNGTWGGPSRTLKATGGPVNEDWSYINGGDGFVCAVDPRDPDLVYGESQDGNVVRRNLRTGLAKSLRPAGTHRFNWNTPFMLSKHNGGIFYSAGEVVFRSVSEGDLIRPISGQITRTDRGTATALSESSVNPDVLWVGSDDGAVHVTRDGGKTWVAVHDALKAAGLPNPRWVSSLEASRFVEGRCYAALDGHRSDDNTPQLFVTEDFGATWKAIANNLPATPTRVLREDMYSAEVLWCGTEFGCFASVNRGVSWADIGGKSLPTVAIHEIAQPTVANEIVVATHGRGIYVLDVTAIRQTKPALFKAGTAHLFAPSPAIRWRLKPSGDSPYTGKTRRFVGENPAKGTFIEFILPEGGAKSVALKITDAKGKTVREYQNLPKTAGFHRVNWDLRRGGPRPAGKRGPGNTAETDLLATPLGRSVSGLDVPPGSYRVVLTVDDKELLEKVLVEGDPNVTEDQSSLDSLNPEAEEVPERRQKVRPEYED